MDLTGLRFGKLTVLERAPNKGKRVMWRCRCDCGREIVTRGDALKSGRTSTCGKCGYYAEYKRINEKVMQCTLRNGSSFIFDAADYDVVIQHHWYISYYGYVVHDLKDGVIRLHRILMNAPEGTHVDHINGDGTDNRRCNLRVCTPKENHRNLKLAVTNKSGYKGVSYITKRQRYRAQISVNMKNKFLGYYSNPIDAARAYDEAARFYFGEFAKTNFGEGGIYGNEQILEMEKPDDYKRRDRRRDSRASA